jgi:hypothetical protein
MEYHSCQSAGLSRILVDEAGEAVLAIGIEIAQSIATYPEIDDTRIDNEVILD